jgi:hypothetical protein
MQVLKRCPRCWNEALEMVRYHHILVVCHCLHVGVHSFERARAFSTLSILLLPLNAIGALVPTIHISITYIYVVHPLFHCMKHVKTPAANTSIVSAQVLPCW